MKGKTVYETRLKKRKVKGKGISQAFPLARSEQWGQAQAVDIHFFDTRTDIHTETHAFVHNQRRWKHSRPRRPYRRARLVARSPLYRTPAGHGLA